MDFTSSTFYRYRQTPNYHIRVKAHAIGVSIRAFTLDSSLILAKFVEQESKRTLLSVCLSIFVYFIGRDMIVVNLLLISVLLFSNFNLNAANASKMVNVVCNHHHLVLKGNGANSHIEVLYLAAN